VYVCLTQNKNCMCDVWTSCSGTETLKALLHNELDDMTAENSE
jgi:hypothetical protein